MRRAQNEKAASYTCPLCDGRLHAMSEHALIAPEGDVSRRRHAHLECVQKAHAAGRLPTYDEWQGEAAEAARAARSHPAAPRLRQCGPCARST